MSENWHMKDDEETLALCWLSALKNWEKVTESRNRFLQEIESRNEEKLSRTQQLNTVKVQALRELGYDVINTENAAEVFEKIAEIQSRGA